MKILMQDNILPGQKLIHKFANAKDLGLDGIELTSFDGVPLENKVKEIEDASYKSGMTAKILCGGYKGWIGDFDDKMRQTAVNDIIDSMKTCKKIGIEGIIAPAAFGMHSNALPPFESPRTKEEDQQALMEALKQIGDAAGQYGVYFYLEPLNRYEDHMLNTIVQGVALIEKLNNPFIRVMGDTFHMNIEEASIPDALMRNGKYIGHIHLADSNRYLPGQGHTDFSKVIQALHEIGYTGYLSYECSVLGDDKLGAIKKSIDHIRQFL